MSGNIINLLVFESDHTHHSTIVNFAEEALAEDLLLYKECFTSVVPGQDSCYV